MNDSFGAGGFNTTTSGATSEGKAEGLIPLMIQQIASSPDDGFSIFGLQYNMVTIVGIIRNVDHSSTKITYQLEDHTGQIDAHLWLEEGETLNMPLVMLNSYARVVGSIRNQGGTKTIMIFKIDPIRSINEVTTHLLEVLDARFKAEEYSKKDDKPFTGDFRAPSSGDHGVDVDVQGLGLSVKQGLVYKAIKTFNDQANGISKNELATKFQHISQQEILAITDFLQQEGHIYTSIDENHFICV